MMAGTVRGSFVSGMRFTVPISQWSLDLLFVIALCDHKQSDQSAAHTEDHYCQQVGL
jgi:hypothetical protein